MERMLNHRAVLILALAVIPARAESLEEQAAKLRALMAGSPKLPLTQTVLGIPPPGPGWALEMVSSVAVDRQGVIYLLQRGAQADPVIAADSNGRVLRSWGKGLFRIPHSIRVDPAGNIWTVDAASSMVYKFSPEGVELLRISVGGLPESRSEFRGTTDIAFGPGGRILIADGYGNARILEYRPDGTRAREWGRRGTAPGEFHLPHGIAIDGDGVVYVADRENGRIQRFDLDGRFQGEWTHLGKTFSLAVSRAGDLWIGTQPRNAPNGTQGWLVRVDRNSGKVLGSVETAGHHSIHVNASGELLTGARPDKVLWFRNR